jgi:hypothetical protein
MHGRRAFCSCDDRVIARDPAGAAKIYLDATKEKYSVEEIVAMIKAPNVVYSTTPNVTMVCANFMFKTGLIESSQQAGRSSFSPWRMAFPGPETQGRSALMRWRVRTPAGLFRRHFNNHTASD